MTLRDFHNTGCNAAITEAITYDRSRGAWMCVSYVLPSLCARVRSLFQDQQARMTQ